MLDPDSTVMRDVVAVDPPVAGLDRHADPGVICSAAFAVQAVTGVPMWWKPQKGGPS